MITIAFWFIAGNPVLANEIPSFKVNNAVSKAISLPKAEKEERWNMAPRVTRAGFFRFLGEDLEDPTWTEFYIKRFSEKGEPLPIRLALLDLILRSGGDWSSSMYKYLGIEEEPSIRAAIIDMTKRLEAEEAIAFIDIAITDDSPEVRSAAMRALGNHMDIDRSVELIAALGDPSDQVRLMAIRTIGWTKDRNAIPALTAFLGDKNGMIRLKSLYALDKVDPNEAKLQATNFKLDIDQSSQVRRLSKRILSK